MLKSLQILKAQQSILSPTKILIRIAGVNGDHPMDVPIMIRLMKDGDFHLNDEPHNCSIRTLYSRVCVHTTRQVYSVY